MDSVLTRIKWSMLCVCLFSLSGARAEPLASEDQTQTEEPAASHPAPTQDTQTISLHLQNLPREQILDEFARVAHVKFDPPAAVFWSAGNWPTPTASLDVTDQPFWIALSHLQEAMDIGFARSGDADHIAVTHDRGDWGWTGRPEAVSGPILFSVYQAGRATTVHFADPSAPADSISMMIRVLKQPGADCNIDHDGVQITSLITDQGIEITSPKTPIHAQSYLNNGQTQIQFETPAPRSGKITSLSLKGNCHCLVSRGQQVMEIDSAERAPVDRKLVGFPIHVATTIAGQNIEVRVTANAPAKQDAKTFERFGNRVFWIWGERLQLFDSKGTEILSNGGGASSGSKSMEVEKRYDQPNVVPPLRIMWTVPIALDETNLPLQIDDIPVP